MNSLRNEKTRNILSSKNMSKYVNEKESCNTQSLSKYDFVDPY